MSELRKEKKKLQIEAVNKFHNRNNVRRDILIDMYMKIGLVGFAKRDNNIDEKRRLMNEIKQLSSSLKSSYTFYAKV